MPLWADTQQVAKAYGQGAQKQGQLPSKKTQGGRGFEIRGWYVCFGRWSNFKVLRFTLGTGCVWGRAGNETRHAWLQTVGALIKTTAVFWLCSRSASRHAQHPHRLERPQTKLVQRELLPSLWQRICTHAQDNAQVYLSDWSLWFFCVSDFFLWILVWVWQMWGALC